MKIKIYQLFILLFLLLPKINFSQVHTSYLWHLQQPIYWPEEGSDGSYQDVKESQDIKNSGGNDYGTGESHPFNDLVEIFSKQDRVNIYQHRAKETVDAIRWLPEAGAQVNYSGCLIENVNSLANANQWGYYSSWADNFQTARSWTTSDGFPRLDIVGFTFHHALSPLISERAFRMELQAHKEIYGNTFGSNPEYSNGYWPAECCFSERNIKILVEEGFEWSIIANSHLARTLNDYPLNYGTSGCNIDPPNEADKVSTNGNNWWNGQIDGRGGTFAAPYCYQAHKAKYVDPETGTEYLIDVVPMADLLSYKDGFSQQGTGDITSNIQPYEDANHPTIVLFAHDGDNAWGGGASYYQEAVPSFVGQANNAGIVPTTIEQFLNDHPVPANDIVHVEDGGWVNAANDWGHPQFINWLWPLYNPATMTFNPDGWTEDARNWAVIIATDNFACMAEDLAGNVDIEDVVYGGSSASEAEKAWHFYLPSLTSGYMYYGKALDMEVKQTIAGNNAIEHAQNVIDANPNIDNTPPSVFIPQRFPYNPGAKGFGPICGYQEKVYSKDFTVWTFGFDVNDISTAALKYRLDDDGINPMLSNENDTYSGGSGVGNWISIDMNSKPFPKDNVTNDPEIDFFVLPTEIANLYWAEIADLENVLVDYYVEMTDTYGNTFKTPIQHVWVGDEQGGGSNPNVYWEPEAPNLNDFITIYSTQATAESKLHWGVNGWNAPIADYQPEGTVIFDEQAVQTPFIYNQNAEMYSVTIGPFNNASQVVENVNFVLKINASTWDNNGGMDYHIEINNVPSENPTSSNFSVSMLMNETYNFTNDDFIFNSSIGASFNGIQIIEIETAGDLEYNNTDVVSNTDYSDVSLLTFTPSENLSGTPYSSFTFKVKDDEGNISDNIYTCTINVTSPNPTSINKSISIFVNETYDFQVSDFDFNSPIDAVFAGIKIIDNVTAGELTYNNSEVAINTDYQDVTQLSFSPDTDEFGTPYTTFTFKVKDNQGNYSETTYIFTINVISNIPDGVSWLPENPTQNDIITIYVKNDPLMNSNSALHWGVNGWTSPIEEYYPENTTFIGPAVETVFTNAGDYYFVQIGPLNNQSQNVTAIDFVLHYGGDAWNNNNGNDWHISIIEVENPNPTGGNNEISIEMNDVYNFQNSDFPFTGINGTTFSGVKIISTETNGDLEYNGSDVVANTDYPEISLLSFMPENNAFGSPYSYFTFKVKDSNGNYSLNSYTMTINVINVSPTGQNEEISMEMNTTYNFLEDDFNFSGVNGATFYGIKIISTVSQGNLKYNNIDVLENSDYEDVTYLTFMPETDEFGTPYTSFTYKLIDDNGNYSFETYSMTIIVEENPNSVDEISDNWETTIYPNPFSEFTIVKINENEINNYNISLLDCTGKILSEDIIQSNESYIINRNNFENGIYFIKFENTSNGSTNYSKIIIY